MASTTSNKGQAKNPHHNETTTSHHHHHHQPNNGNHNPYRRQRRQIQGEHQQSQSQPQPCGNDESNSSDYTAAMPQRNDEEYCKEIARKAVARAALHLGVEGMGADALDVLGDVLISYLERIGRVLASTVEASTRTSAHCNILDALHAAEACTAPAAYQVLLTSRDTAASSSSITATTPGQKPPPIMAQNSAAMMQDCGWEGLAAFLFGKDWLSLPLPVVGTAGLDDSVSTRTVNGTNSGAGTSITNHSGGTTTTTTTTTTTPGMNNTNTTNSNIYTANGNNNNNNNNNGGINSSSTTTTPPSSSSTTNTTTGNTTNTNTTKPLNRAGVGKQLPPKPPNSFPQGGKAINYTTTGATGKSIPNENSTSTTTTTPPSTTTKLQKGWNAPYLEHLPLFPTSRHPKANPHRLPQSIGFSFHSLAVEEEACRVDLIGMGGGGKGQFHSDSMGGETGRNVTAIGGKDGTAASSLSTTTTTTAGTGTSVGAGGATESTSTISNTNGKGGGDAMKKGGVGLAPSSSSTAKTTSSLSKAAAASAEEKADMEARRIPEQIYRNEVTSSFWGTVGSSQYGIHSGQQHDGSDCATMDSGDKMDVDGGTTKLLDGANATNNGDSLVDGSDNVDGSGNATGNKRRVHFDEHQDGGPKKKLKTGGGEGTSATGSNDSALSSLTMGRSRFASGSGLEEERRRPAYVPPFFPPFPPEHPFDKKSAKGAGISSMVLSTANTSVTDRHSKQLSHLALRKSSTAPVETRSSSSIPTAVNSEYDEIGQQAVRSSLVSLGRTVGTAFWGSAWTDHNSESVPDSVSSSGNNRNRTNEFIQTPPLGRAPTNKKPDVSVVSLGRASGSRVCRILEGSMDAYQ